VPPQLLILLPHGVRIILIETHIQAPPQLRLSCNPLFLDNILDSVDVLSYKLHNFPRNGKAMHLDEFVDC
jgi:hypothetical protein